MTRKRKPTKPLADVFVADDRVPEEERNPDKFDRVEEEEASVEDEEIDEELAFNSEDELQFSTVFASHRQQSIEACKGDAIDEIFGSEVEEEDPRDNLPVGELSKVGLGKGRRKKSPVESELRDENFLNLVGGVGKMSSLVSGVGELRSKLKGVHKSLDLLDQHGALSVPLPQALQDKQKRRAGYSKTVEFVSKWGDIVYANRKTPCLDFAPPNVGLQRTSRLEEMVEDHVAGSRMEKEIAGMLEKADVVSGELMVKMEDDLALEKMSLEELKEKRGKLAKMRSLLFHHEMKSRQIKKIKSKEYHRRLQRSYRKRALRFGGLENEEATKKMLEEMEYNRMKERLTQKHSTMNRFARRIMRRGWGVADEQTKQALEEQLRQSQELKQKIQSVEEDSVEESEEEEDDYSTTRKALTKILNEEVDVEEGPKKGVLALPFMKKALKKQQEQNQMEAEKILQSFDPQKKEEEEPRMKSRRQFSGGKGKEFKLPLQDGCSKENPEGEEDARSDHGIEAKEKRKLKDSMVDEKVDGMTQEELIKLAFEDDEVEEDFDKQQEVEKELPPVEEVSLLPGWGRWKNEQREPKWMEEKRKQSQKLRDLALQKRKDFRKKGVFLSEKEDSKALDKYRVSSVPRSYSSVEEYEASIQHSLGLDCNTLTAFEDFTRPKILKRHGVIIEPLRLPQNVEEVREDVKEVKDGRVKVRRLVGGEIQEQVLLDHTTSQSITTAPSAVKQDS